ncbi:unnamed protein product [Effrenium voratum]|nr:unnamed protein product [Effrenium voratum]
MRGCLELQSLFKGAYWFFLDEIVAPCKGHFPSLGAEQFVQLLAAQEQTPNTWVEEFQQWSQRQLAKPRCGAAIFDARQERLLMVQSFHRVWCFPAGKLEEGEEEVDCAVREVQEEIGIDIADRINERQFVKSIITDKQQRAIPVKLFIITGIPEKSSFKPRVKQEIEKIAWIRVSKLPGWGSEATNLRFLQMGSLVPELKRWLSRGPEEVEADAPLAWLHLGRALDAFDREWSGEKRQAERGAEVSWGDNKDGDLGAMPSCKDDEKLSYRRLRLLGQGSFGKAFLARDLSNNELVVMKQVRVEKMDAKARDTAVREAVALRKVRHPNVVRFRQVFVRSGWLCLVMDFADGGDLCAAVKDRAKSGQPFEESAVLECFSQVADAVRYVHAHKMVHRDIKSRNVFLCRTGQALLGDFGLVRLLESTLELAHTRVGTPYYLSPEIIRKQPYNYKTDVWSLGVLLYEMAALKRPFMGTLETLPKIILKGDYEPLGGHFSPALHGLVARLLALDPNQRPPLAELLQEEANGSPGFPVLHA